MTYEGFQKSVETMISNLTAIKASASAAGWSFQYHDVGLEVCECAAELGGFDPTFAKMFNRKFRENAVNLMLERAAA